jgi:hypothetical protein
MDGMRAGVSPIALGLVLVLDVKDELGGADGFCNEMSISCEGGVAGVAESKSGSPFGLDCAR